MANKNIVFSQRLKAKFEKRYVRIFNKKEYDFELSSSIDYSFLDDESTVRITLPISAVTANMQEDKAAFEGWAAVIHEITNGDILLDIKSPNKNQKPWDEYGENSEKYRHYNRFLYRLMKFSEAYPYFKLSDELKKHIGEFYYQPDKKYYAFSSSKLYENRPGSEAKCNDKKEIIIEKYWHDNPLKLIRVTKEIYNIDMEDSINRQLPVGIFKDKIGEQNAVFTGGASAIDLWGISKDRKTLFVYELKAEDNNKIGIISELFFYANVVYDIYNSSGLFATTGKEKKKQYRGYEKLQELNSIKNIAAIFLVPEMHPAITDDVINSLNKNKKHILFSKICYKINAIDISEYSPETKFID